MQPIPVNSCGECPFNNEETAQCGRWDYVATIGHNLSIHTLCPINNGEPFTIIFEPKNEVDERAAIN